MQPFIQVSSKRPHLYRFYLCMAYLLTSALQPSLAQIPQKLWTQTERQLLVAGLQSSQNDFINELTGLTEQQIHFKPDTATWSIAEVAEHVGIYDELLYWDLVNNQYTPEMPEWVEKVNGVDSVMLAYTSDPVQLRAPLLSIP
ncbi:DinB family protein [Spirosoma sp. BT702]|uniref:DinB family protein n=1 Tax=Spirosoma profusum TaxID=2771354 RepID=A0A927AWR5_9BACT|nr:DinB family protein [Spirosoma profusum]MBD2705809.1 DinB family protein [Spirosoma profusum]